MARKLNPKGLINQENYIFAHHAQYKDKVFETFKRAAELNKLPCKINVEEYKSGGLFGSKDSLLTIDGGFTPFCVLGATTYGDYLVVSLYVLVEDTFMNKLAAAASRDDLTNIAYYGEDMISVRNMEAFIASVSETLQETFGQLKFVETKRGFLGIK